MPRKTKRPGQDKRRVLLLCTQPLLADGLRAILSGLDDVELTGPLVLDAQAIERVPDTKPDVLLIAEDGSENFNATSFTAQILEHYPDVPVIRVGLRQNTMRLHTSRTLPARSADLIDAIRRLPALAELVARQEPGVAHTKT